ncbi:MAG: argininosuccinate synthase, partial [Spirochaetales bacterium]|nr:argininosuccinate synthase [Spirochaetales bacterium]
GTAAARPVIARSLAELALAEGCSAVAHGCTGKGNDQVRFEMGIKAFAPQLEVLAPWRIWDLTSREEEIAYLEARGIAVPFRAGDSYSRDDNLWHVSHEGLDLEDPANEPVLEGMLKMSVPPAMAPDEPEYVNISFEAGVPVAVNGIEMDGVALISALNEIGGKHGVGIVDMVENRVVGMKSRGVYETPAGTIIMEAHKKLEQLCLDRKTQSFKATLSQRFAELLYEGEWYSPLMDAMNAFVDSTQKVVTGMVTLKLWKGTMTGAGMSSPYSLYDDSLASFATGPLYDHRDAGGFINLYSLPVKARGLMKARHASLNFQPRHVAAGATLPAADVAAAS